MKRIGKECTEGCSKVFETTGAWLKQVDNCEQPVTIGMLGLKSDFVPFFLDKREQFLGRISTNVFGVEPVQLGAIEDRVGARDAA